MKIKEIVDNYSCMASKDLPSIQGVPDPRKPHEIHKESVVDGDKFKKIMKVDESDETQKRGKRNLPKSEEEEEEDVQGTELPPSSTESIFSRDGETLPDLSSTSADSPTPYTITEQEFPTEAITIPSITTEEPVVEHPPTKSSTKKPEEKPVTLHHLEEKKAPKETTAISHKKEPEPTAVVTPLEPQKSQSILLSAATKKEEKSLPKKEKSEEPTPPLSFAGSDALFTLGKSETVASPTYTMLPAEVFEIFERMIGYMTVEETKGISTTTVKLSMPGSIFDGCEIKLDHYDTAPHSYNIQFLGTPAAVTLFATHLDDLAAAFQQTRYSFRVQLQTPILLETSRPVLRRKPGGSKKESGSGSKKQQ